MLDKNYGIRIPEISRPQSKMPNMSIPNYMGFKQKLQDINKVHAIASASINRRSRAFYSPIIKNTAKSLTLQKSRFENDISRGNMPNYESPPIVKKYKALLPYSVEKKATQFESYTNDVNKKLNYSINSKDKFIGKKKHKDKEVKKWNNYTKVIKLPDIRQKDTIFQL